MPTPETEPTRLDAVFARTRGLGRPALVGYLPAGYPTVATSARALRALAEHLDAIEIGVPRIEPLTRPLHRIAARTALDSGATPRLATDLIRHLSAAAPHTPVLLNPPRALLTRVGAHALADALATAGGAGVVLTDLHPENTAAQQWKAAANPHQLATVCLCAHGQVGAAARASTGAVYLPGLTGKAGSMAPATLGLRRGQLRPHATSGLPVLVGRGITSPQQAADLARHADGFAIGSILIAAAEAAPDPDTAVVAISETARRFATELRPHAKPAASRTVA